MTPAASHTDNESAIRCSFKSILALSLLFVLQRISRGLTESILSLYREHREVKEAA